MSDRYYLFKGCLIPTRIPNLEKASLIALDSMGVDHRPLPGATCCVEPIGLRSMAADTWLGDGGPHAGHRREDGRDVLTLCNGCYLSFQEAGHALQEPAVRDRGEPHPFQPGSGSTGAGSRYATFWTWPMIKGKKA
ncbi:MAG: heterodisulfide reductase-related iron-sulfur binding cluster [Desulfobacterales bacterium]|nr:heterodisulfide reductase-related iron-sulfur binding cluster [Desulfobacterales bacterium]